MMIALPNLDGSFTCHPVLAQDRPGRAGLAADARGDHLGIFERTYPGRRPADARPGRGLPDQPGRLAGDRPVPAVGHRAGGARRRRRARHRALLRAGRERRHGGLRRARPLPRRVAAATGPARWRSTSSQRKPNTDAIADYALENFVEMRDSGGLAALPRADGRCSTPSNAAAAARYVSRYEMVSFSTVPYAEIGAAAAPAEPGARRGAALAGPGHRRCGRPAGRAAAEPGERGAPDA